MKYKLWPFLPGHEDRRMFPRAGRRGDMKPGDAPTVHAIGEMSFRTGWATVDFSVSSALSTPASMSDDIARTTSGNGGGEVGNPFATLSGRTMGVGNNEREDEWSSIDGGLKVEKEGRIEVLCWSGFDWGRPSGGTVVSGSPYRCSHLLECRTRPFWMGMELSVVTSMGSGMPNAPRGNWFGAGGPTLFIGNGRLLLVTRINGYERTISAGRVGECATRWWSRREGGRSNMCEACRWVGAKWEVIKGRSSKGTMGEILETKPLTLGQFNRESTYLIGCDSEVLAFGFKLGCWKAIPWDNWGIVIIDSWEDIATESSRCKLSVGRWLRVGKGLLLCPAGVWVSGPVWIGMGDRMTFSCGTCRAASGGYFDTWLRSGSTSIRSLWGSLGVFAGHQVLIWLYWICRAFSSRTWSGTWMDNGIYIIGAPWHSNSGRAVCANFRALTTHLQDQTSTYYILKYGAGSQDRQAISKHVQTKETTVNHQLGTYLGRHPLLLHACGVRCVRIQVELLLRQRTVHSLWERWCQRWHGRDQHSGHRQGLVTFTTRP